MPEKEQKQEAGVPAQFYLRIFEGDPDGQKILEEMSRLFHDRPIPSLSGDVALYSEGQRSVMLFLFSKIAEAKQ